MITIERILYPTDFSGCAAAALPHATQLAQRHGAELHMLHAHVLHETQTGDASLRFPKLDELYEVLEQNAEDQMNAALEPHGNGSLRINRAQMRSISAPESILAYAGENDIDLIVMGTHGRRGLRRLLLGSVAEEVVRLAPCPVLTVCATGETSPSSVKRILVPVDFSDYAKLALSYAGELAEWYGATLLLLHIVDEATYPDFYPPLVPTGRGLAEQLKEQSITRLEKLLADVQPKVSGEVRVGAGRAASEIPDFARVQSVDLIVIASHGLTGLSHMLLGSVTEHVVRRAHCPVFTVKAFGRDLIKS